MKLLLIIVSIIAVCAHEEPDSAAGEPGNINSAEEDANHLFSNQNAHISRRSAKDNTRSKGSKCKATDTCIILGGSCVTNATLCGGRLVSTGCKGKNCKCCVPDLGGKISELQQDLKAMKANLTGASSSLHVEFQSRMDNLTDSINSMGSKLDTYMRRCPVGFINAAGSSKCYKFYNDTTRSWTSAKEKCQAEGLVLAEPTNSLSLRKYLVETYGQRTGVYVWLGACGTGSYYKWDRSGTQISNTDSLWYPSHPGKSVSTSHCILMLSDKSYLSSQPNKPYYAYGYTNKHFTLCEYITE